MFRASTSSIAERLPNCTIGTIESPIRCRHVHFLDGERLLAINDYSTLQMDATIRARLSAVRMQLLFIVTLLEDIDEKNFRSKRLSPSGVALYLSEPLGIDEFLHKQLSVFWYTIEQYEEMRTLIGPFEKNSAVVEVLAKKVIEIAQRLLKNSNELMAAIDKILERMKPIV